MKKKEEVEDVSIECISKGIDSYIENQYKKKVFNKELYDKSKKNIIHNLISWLDDPLIDTYSPNLKIGIINAYKEKRYADICEIFIGDIAFGTAGIRGRAVLRAFDDNNPKDELIMLTKDGIDAKILKGPNSINNIVLLIKSAGLAKYANSKRFNSINVGYDSRIHGKEFAELVTQLFLAYGMKVYLFDEACPYPELMISVNIYDADLGVFISASHNDKRYNGYKICRFGAQLDPDERDDIYKNFIAHATTRDIKLKDLDEAKSEELIYLGGKKSLEGHNYHSSKYRRTLLDIHSQHIEHSKSFILDKMLVGDFADRISIGYSAFHGAGRRAVPRLLMDFGFINLKLVDSMHDLNGLFPTFSVNQQPDPGDEETMQIAINEFIKEHGKENFSNLDIFIGTDPDADRAGIVVKVPDNQITIYGKSHTLLSADEAWTLLLWYRIKKLNEMNMDLTKSFIALSHVTSEAMIMLARKNRIGYITTWVGFSNLASATKKAWDSANLSPYKNPGIIFEEYTMKNRNFNILSCEQSNGFSILGGKPKNDKQLGVHGHVKDKDGILAALLLCELAAYAHSVNKTFIDLLDENVYLDPYIGLFVNSYVASPKFGQYEGLDGMSRKIDILKCVVDASEDSSKISFAGMKPSTVDIYRTGKYDGLHNWQGFPDEGVRFYFSDRFNHLTIRPSGTSQSLRIHVQLRSTDVNKESIILEKSRLRELAKAIIADAKKKFKIKE